MIREVLDELDPDLGRVGSELEARFLRFLEDHGLPRPTQQFPLPWRTPRPGFSDHAFVQQRLLVELDGRIWHSDSASFESDHDRDLQATLHGWSVMRITARQLDGTPQLVAHALRRVLDDPAA